MQLLQLCKLEKDIVAKPEEYIRLYLNVKIKILLEDDDLSGPIFIHHTLSHNQKRIRLNVYRKWNNFQQLFIIIYIRKLKSYHSQSIFKHFEIEFEIVLKTIRVIIFIIFLIFML